MKRILPIAAAFLLPVMLNGQIILTFSGTGAASRVDSVKATNLTTGQAISLPGQAELILSNKTGTDEIIALSEEGIVFPNPLMGQATFSMYQPDDGMVSIAIRALDGRLVAAVRSAVPAGTHDFTFSLARIGIYCLTATSGKGTTTYKIINAGTGTDNSLSYRGRSR